MPASPQNPYTSVGVSRETLDRIDRLRLIQGRSRSRVIEEALLHGGLSAQEGKVRAAMRTVDALAAVRHQSWQELVRAYAAEYAGKTYPPTVEQIMSNKEDKQVAELLKYDAGVVPAA